MSVYLPGAGLPEWQWPEGEGEPCCPWCGDPVDLSVPCVSPPTVQRLLFHADCAAHMGESLIADAREATLAVGDREWASRAVAVVRYRLRRQEES